MGEVVKFEKLCVAKPHNLQRECSPLAEEKGSLRHSAKSRQNARKRNVKQNLQDKCRLTPAPGRRSGEKTRKEGAKALNVESLLSGTVRR